MNFRPSLLLLVALPLTALAAGETTPAPAKPSLMNRLLHPFGGGSPAPASAMKDMNFKNLEMGLVVEPPAPRLSETKEIKVTVTLADKGKKLLQLTFPTTQRIEVLVKNKAGKVIVRWSEDQAFLNEPTLVAINPGERLEYAATVATRDLVAGETYTVEAFFPTYEPLRQTRALTPLK